MAGERGRSRREAAPRLPPELRRLWGLEPAARRGRPAELGVERVVRAAVALADRDGLAGATLPRIAKALGYSAMALYRHVGSKAMLFSLMRDLAAGPPPVIDLPPGEWRESLRRWAQADRRLNQKRPWLARLPIAGPPIGPHEVAWMETGLHALRGTPLDWAEKVGLLMLIGGYVRQSSLLAQDLERGRGSRLDQPQSERRYGRLLQALVDTGRFPETARLVRSGLFEASSRRRRSDPAADPEFVFGLERILDGAAVTIARKGERPGATRSGTSRKSRPGGAKP